MHYTSSFFIVFLASLVSQPVFASCPVQKQIRGEFIVLKNNENSSSLKTFTTEYSNLNIESIHINKAHNLSLSKTSTTSLEIETLLVKNTSLNEVTKAFPNANIQQNCQVELLQSVPSQDTFYTFQSWYLNNLNAPYEVTTPLRPVVVAVSDTGVDTNHPDLINNLWTNSAELNGVFGEDDDGNGYVDDIHGYDLGDNDNNPIPSIRDSALDFDHGTHVAGLIAAQSLNGQGISGISLNTTQIMALKGFKSNSVSTIADLLKTIYYAVDNGADIINASWGAEKQAEAAEIEAVNYATQRGVLIVAAAGNSRVPASWFSPAGIGNVVTVGALNSRDQMSTFSNYGEAIDFVAPGGDGSERLNESLVSTGISSDYIELRGTSMSAPLVSGALAQLMALNPSMTSFQILRALEITSERLTLQPYQNTNNTVTYLKPNLQAALDYLTSDEEIPNEVPPPEDITAYESRSIASESTGGSGGCSNSLSSQVFEPGANSQSGVPLGAVSLLLLPIMVTIRYKKRPRKGPSQS